MKKGIFVVPADFNLDSLAKFINSNDKYELKVAELYGSLKTSKLGSGRKHSDLPATSFNDFENYVNECKKNNIEFNYTLNSNCCSNKEFTIKGKKQIITDIEKLVGIGINKFTIALPSLISIMASEFPSIEVTLSIICGVDSPSKMRFYCQYDNIKNIYISESVYRNTKLLKELIDIAHENNKDVGILVNSFCLPDCPLRNYHYSFGAHAVPGTNYTVPEYYASICALMKINDKKNVLNAPWIRPNNLMSYIDLGIDRLKISGRERILKSADFHKVVQVYNSQHYDGNLIELFMCFSECAHSEIFNMQNDDKLDSYINSILNGKHRCNFNNCKNCTFCKHALESIKINESASVKWTKVFTDKIIRL